MSAPTYPAPPLVLRRSTHPDDGPLLYVRHPSLGWVFVCALPGCDDDDDDDDDDDATLLAEALTFHFGPRADER